MSRSVVFRGEQLGRALGLTDLWIAFNGYWPERGALFETGSFKDLEAMTVLGRLPQVPPTLVVASSGNTGMAFAAACSRHLVPCFVVIPSSALPRIRLREELSPVVRLIVLNDAEYSDAIAFAEAMARLSGVYGEGGVRNIGRRDGLATVLYSAFEVMLRLPEYYFQAVGSGAGAVATHEAADRLRAAVGGTGRLPRLMLCQNAPFAPIYDSWKYGRDHGAGIRWRQYKVEQMRADELANARPPFYIRGGVRDSLEQSSGEVMTAGNRSIDAAIEAFGELESIDIGPAAGTAVACLRDAARARRIPPDAPVLLNITSGGRQRLESDYSLVPAEPARHFNPAEVADGRALEEVAQMLRTLRGL